MSARLAGKMLLVSLAALGAGGNAPARAADEPKVVKLPAPASHTVVAADGRFLVLHLPKAKRIAVFDVKEEKIAKLLPAPDDDIILAGALDYAFVVRKSNNTMQRWNLATFEKEATVRLPADGPFASICMGCSANGPMLLFPRGKGSTGGKLMLLNPVTMREVPTTGWLPPAAYDMIHATPDGRVFVWPTDTGGTAVMRSVDGKYAAKTLAGQGHGLRPGPGARFFYNGAIVYDDQGRQLHPRPGTSPNRANTSAVQGPIFLELEWVPGAATTGARGYGKVHVFLEGQFKPVATIDGIDKHPTSNSSPHLIPRFKRLIFSGTNNDELILYPFDIDALLAKSDGNYLVVVSEPPRQAVAGKPFEYATVVKSKKGGVKLKLDAAPDGMKLADGKLTWDVPADQAGQEASVVLTVSDDSGQELFHTFRFTVVPAPAKP